jgi:O-antigen ligase
VVALTATFALAAIWPLIADSEFVRGRVLDPIPVYARIVTTATAMNMFVHSPLVGHGFGRYTYDSKKWDYIVGVFGLSSQFAYTTGVPHNEYMHVLVLLGLAGFIPYVAILVIAWRTAARHYRDRFSGGGPSRDIALIVLSALGLYLTTAGASDAFAFNYGSVQVYTLFGAIEGLRARESGSFDR